MEKAILDFTGCKYFSDFHKRIKEALQFPEYYGENWDAFWDCVICESPIEFIEIRGEHTLPESWASQIEFLHQILLEAKSERAKYGQEFDYVIVD
ncbi:MAG: hypothetical protein E7434_09205 [Ruminococcaceae bacterium]|nr:hypothetical protein [Oscillospiraceae bacterium]